MWVGLVNQNSLSFVSMKASPVRRRKMHRDGLTASMNHGRQPPVAQKCSRTEPAASRWLHALVRCHGVISAPISSYLLPLQLRDAGAVVLAKGERMLRTSDESCQLCSKQPTRSRQGRFVGARVA
jgi:hypothetical protein